MKKNSSSEDFEITKKERYEWKLGVGLIGCGWAGRQHARAYSLLRDHVDLVAAAGLDYGKAKSLAQNWGFLSWHRDYRKVLSNPRVEIVSICLPVYLHADVSVEAAETGKHVLCEKPMAGTLLKRRMI